MVVGCSGGSRIISSVAQAIIRTLIFNQKVKEAVDAPRIHNQFFPHVTEVEASFSRLLIEKLENDYGQKFTTVSQQESAVQALIVMDNGFIHGNSDFRRKTDMHPSGY